MTAKGYEKTLGGYHDMYLKTDVLLLADVFENFWDTCLKHYQLDPAHFYTAPGLALDSCLEDNRDQAWAPNRHRHAPNVREGYSEVVSHRQCTRYAKANNKYMGDQYNPKKESSYVQYLDVNNLYGCAMSKLSHSGFKWEKQVEEVYCNEDR